MTLRIGDPRVTASVAISTAATGLSGALDCGGYRLAGLVMPSTWTTASITFQASADGVTYQSLYGDTGGEVTITAPTSALTMVMGTPATVSALGSFRYLKVRSGTAALAVAQTTDRTITAVLVPL